MTLEHVTWFAAGLVVGFAICAFYALFRGDRDPRPAGLRPRQEGEGE